MTTTITLAQLNPTVGDIAGNRDKALSTWKNAGSDLIVFPELFLSGYPPEDLVLKPAFMKKIHAAVDDILKESKNFKSAAIIPTPWMEGGKIYNALHVIENGKILHTYKKHTLPNYGVFDEKRVFTSGPLPEVFKFRGINLGLMICEDMWYPASAAHLKKQGAEILIVPNASPFVSDKQEIRLKYAQMRVRDTGLPLLYLNQVGGQDELVFDGASFVMNAKGEVVLQMKGFEEEIATISLPLSLNPSPLRERESARSAQGEGLLKDIYGALTLGLRDYIRKNNFPGILLGLSGGIDSALSAVIAADAIGPENVHCIMMPSRFTSKDSIEDAATLAKNLNIKLDTISIENPVGAFHKILQPYLKNAPPTTLENIQPRARGLILMALSNATGKMVLSTGNKSEMAVGYATLYGDMCGGFNVLKDIYKTQVYELSRWRNKNNLIPERIFTKAPTAELKDNQTDQDTLPPYAELDTVLACLIEQDLGIDETAALDHDRTTVAKVSRMLDLAEYKRRQGPPGIKITSRAFGRDRRYPITNKF